MKKSNPIGIDTQLENVLFGESQQEKDETQDKIDLIKSKVNDIAKINGCKVFNVMVKDDIIKYNLQDNRISDYRKYYYPIKYANIEFSK